MRLASCALLFAAACAADAPSDDVTGPYTGTTHRYTVDKFLLPTTNTEARAFGGDLNGDGAVDNQLGMVLSTIHGQGLDPPHIEDMIASGALASSVEITANDLANDDTVAVLYRGNDSSTGVPVGGTLVDGWFRSNRAATTHAPGHAFARIPVFGAADPSEIEIGDLEIDLQPDGHGGFDAEVHGTVDSNAALKEAYRSSMQMLAADPDGHFYFMALFDQAPRDWVISENEFTHNDLMESLFEPDITMHGVERLSIGFKLHLSPCDQGTCSSSPPADTCDDRMLDGDETDIDCGGSCAVCGAGAQCMASTDCDSQRCDGTGHCAAASCEDGVRDGFETDVDCGSNCGKTCQDGQRCHGDDCVDGLVCGEGCNNNPLGCAYFSTCH